MAYLYSLKRSHPDQFFGPPDSTEVFFQMKEAVWKNKNEPVQIQIWNYQLDVLDQNNFNV